MSMKKLLALLGVTLLAVSAFADERSTAVLERLEREVAGWEAYRVEFTVEIDGQAVSGSYEVDGEAYKVVTPEIVLYCDGATKWEVHLTDREIIVDAVDPTDRSVLANPTRLFDFLDGSHTHRFIGPAQVNGVNCNKIELREVGQAGDPGTGGWNTGATEDQTVDVYIAVTTGLPVRLNYKMAMLGTDAVIDVARITPHIITDASFTYRTARYAGFEVIDFR